MALSRPRRQSVPSGPANTRRPVPVRWCLSIAQYCPRPSTEHTLVSQDYRKVGTFLNPDGHTQNEGLTRMLPLALSFRKAPDEVLMEAVRGALLFSTIHTTVIGSCFAFAKAIALLLREEVCPARALLRLSVVVGIACVSLYCEGPMGGCRAQQPNALRTTRPPGALSAGLKQPSGPGHRVPSVLRT